MKIEKTKNMAKMKLTLITMIVTITSDFCTISASADPIKCEFALMVLPYTSEHAIYTCKVQNVQIFENEELINFGSSGQHNSGKDDSQVKGFFIANARNMRKFPVSVSEVFSNLIWIDIFQSGITELNDIDLQAFWSLKYLLLQGNEIESLKAGTFDFNPNLEVIWLASNRINHIEPNTFANLQKLRILGLNSILCSSLNNYMNREDVIEAVQQIDDGICTADEFTTTTTTTTTTEAPRKATLLECEEKGEELVSGNERNEEQIEQNKQGIDEQRRKIASLSADIENIADQLRSKNKEIESLSEKLKDSNEKVDDLHGKIQKLSKKSEALRNLRQMMIELAGQEESTSVLTQVFALSKSKVLCKEKIKKLAASVKNTASTSEMLDSCRGQLTVASALLANEKSAAERCN